MIWKNGKNDIEKLIKDKFNLYLSSIIKFKQNQYFSY